MEKQRISLNTPQPRSASPARRLPVRNLLQNANTLILEHKGQDYILRVTRNGKLILTK
jgi:hemin uptake protein HemP